ncbi:hypothetical protein MTP99_002682 [Tenebrio molitor]|nr:hypothetical protein MTP99_002682 [Tenebrio molitor]
MLAIMRKCNTVSRGDFSAILVSATDNLIVCGAWGSYAPWATTKSGGSSGRASGTTTSSRTISVLVLIRSRRLVRMRPDVEESQIRRRCLGLDLRRFFASTYCTANHPLLTPLEHSNNTPGKRLVNFLDWSWFPPYISSVHLYCDHCDRRSWIKRSFKLCSGTNGIVCSLSVLSALQHK